MTTSDRSHSTKQMHKIVWIMVGVFGLIAATFPTAMFRVSNMEKFKGFHVKSFTIEGQPQQNTAQTLKPASK